MEWRRISAANRVSRYELNDRSKIRHLEAVGDESGRHGCIVRDNACAQGNGIGFAAWQRIGGCGEFTTFRVHLMDRCATRAIAHPGHDRPARLTGQGHLRQQKQDDCQRETQAT